MVMVTKALPNLTMTSSCDRRMDTMLNVFRKNNNNNKKV